MGQIWDRLSRNVATALVAIVLVGCTSNIGRSESPTTEPPITSTTSTVANVISAEATQDEIAASWAALGDSENAFSQSEISELEYGKFGLMAAPGLRLFKFKDSKWEEVTQEYLRYFDVPETGLDYEIIIQSQQVTGDSALDFVVGFAVAEWQRSSAPMTRGTQGIVLSGEGGMWRSVAFWAPYETNLEREYTSIKFVEVIGSTLYGYWYGSCGNPCGTLVYQWSSDTDRLEGIDATEYQKSLTDKPTCATFKYNESFPLEICNEGLGVKVLQAELTDLGYEFYEEEFFGDQTRFAVQLYQRQNGLRATGRVNEATWRKLFEGRLLTGTDLNDNGMIEPKELSGT